MWLYKSERYEKLRGEISATLKLVTCFQNFPIIPSIQAKLMTTSQQWQESRQPAYRPINDFRLRGGWMLKCDIHFAYTPPTQKVPTHTSSPSVSLFFFPSTDFHWMALWSYSKSNWHPVLLKIVSFTQLWTTPLETQVGAMTLYWLFFNLNCVAVYSKLIE